MLLPIFPYKQFCLILNSLRQNCDWKEIIWDIAIRPVLNSPADNVKAKGAKIKQGEYFPLVYTVILYIIIIMVNTVKQWSLHGIDTAVMNMNPPCDDFCFLILPPFVIFQAQSVNFALYTIIWTAVSDTDLLVPIQTTH